MSDNLHTETHYQQLVLALLISCTDAPMAIAANAFRSTTDPEMKALFQNVGDSLAGIRMLLQHAINLSTKTDHV